MRPRRSGSVHVFYLCKSPSIVFGPMGHRTRMQRMTAGRDLAVRQVVPALRLRAIVAELNEFGMEASEPAKPGQQVIIYGLRPLLLSPVAAAWKQVKPSQVRQCAPHEGQAVSKHLENPVPLAADVERRLFDAASLEAP
jgi:hypothetical protein